MASDIERLTVVLEANIKKYEKELNRTRGIAERNLRAVEKSTTGHTTRLAGIMASAGKTAANGFATGFAVLGVGGIAAGLGLTALVDSARTAAAELAKIGDVAGRIGVTAEALQALQFASEQNAGSAEAVNTGLTRFAAGMADASAKGGDLYKVLEANNVAFQDASGKLLPVQTVLAKYADLIQNAKTPAEQLELAIRAFGRAAGPELVGLLSQGSGGLRDMMQQAKDAGAVLDNDIIAKAQEIDDKFAAIARTVGTQLKGAIVGLFPLLEQFAAHVQRGANMLKLIGPNANRIDDAFNVNAVAKPGSLRGHESALKGVATPAETPLTLRLRPTILPAAGDGGASKAQAAAERLANSYKQMIATAQGRIESLKVEQQALGMTTAEAEKLRFETDLLNEATRDGATLTDAQRAQISQLASTYGVLAGEVERAKKAQADAAETMQNLEDIASGGVKGLVSDLMEGTDAATALQNALKRVGDQLLDMALNSALKGMFTGGSGSGGGLGGLIGNLFSPGKASGGPVKAGQPYTVGESGRETFVPTQPGRIIPHGRGGGNVQVVVNNNAGAQVSARQTNGPQGPAIHVQIDEAVANALSNGSKTASVLKAWGGNKMR